jgi:hypothetical protein
MMPGRGTTLCGAPTRAGTPCCDWVIAGFDTCLHHIHPGQLEEAEAVVGFKLCRQSDCRQYAISYTDPPRCRTHCSGWLRQVEYRRHFERVVQARKAELMAALFRYQDGGDRSPEVLRLLGLDA